VGLRADPFGYRVASAVFGSLAILLMCRIRPPATRSTPLAAFAGLLLYIDGMEFVLSRTGILDIFLMFFVLAAFGRNADRPGSVPVGDWRGRRGCAPG